MKTRHIVRFAVACVALAAPIAVAAPPAPNLEERTVSVDGQDVHFRTGGSGPHLLLLHGFSLTNVQWDPFLPELTQHFTVIAAELPGHGGSDRPELPYNFSETAKTMFGLLDELGVKQIRGIGHSAGALTLLNMAAQQPERVEAMALVAGGPRFAVEGRESLRKERFDALPAEFQQHYLDIHPGGREQVDWIYKQMVGLADDYENFSMSPERLALISTRTLLVWGDQDPGFPVEFAVEMLGALPHAQLWVVPGQGHMLLWPSWGGSEPAAETFPRVAIEFFQEDVE